MSSNESYQYCFVLGINHTLCKVDILNTLVSQNIDFQVLEASQETLIIETQEILNPRKIINDLGGTVKFIRFFTFISHNDNFLEKLRSEIIKKEFKNFFLPSERKHIPFGLSVYSSGGKLKELNNIWYLAPTVCQEIKKELMKAGKKTGFLSLKDRKLSSVSVDKNRLLDHGFELVLGVGQKGVYVGKSLSVQDYESYGFRDYGRPERDARAGMIPPRLAKMMINLAQKNKEDVFLDPFCGSGTFLGELILIGYKNLIGGDIDKKAIARTQVNLDWLFRNYQSLKREDYNLSLRECDARRLSSIIPEESIDAIVTEPYLGSPKTKFYQPNKIKKEISILEDLYSQSFREFKRVFKKRGIVVIIFPVFRYKNQFFFLEILERIKSLGYERKNFLPETITKDETSIRLLNLEISNRNSIIYYRSGQTISREIFLFVKQ